MTASVLEATPDVATPARIALGVGDGLAAGLAVALKALYTKTTVPILANVLLEHAGTTLTATITDLETSVIVELPVDVAGDPFATTVDAKQLYAIVKGASRVSLAIEDAKLVVATNTTRTRLLTLPDSDYPRDLRRRQHHVAASYGGDLETLRELLADATAFASNEDARGAVLMGLFFDFPKHRIAATDGYALLTDTLPLERLGHGDAPEGAIVPARALTPLRAIKVARKAGPIGVTIDLLGSRYIRFTTHVGGARYDIVTRLVDGNYPNVDQVIPVTPTGFDMIVDSAALGAAVKQAESLFGGSRYSRAAGRVHLTLDAEQGILSSADTIAVTAASDIAGNVDTTVPIELVHVNGPMSISFSPPTIARCLAAFHGAAITMSWTAPDKAAVFHAGSRRIAGMPLRG
jgi:DNA polymerase III sliding clamp (beta) subunit (PCNA family)